MKPDLSPCTVNAQLNDEMHNTLHITRVMQEILNPSNTTSALITTRKP